MNYVRVAVEKNIKTAVVNNDKNPCKIRLYEGFYFFLKN